ncbi:MAG: dihydrolipoyl dehydrogenase [Dehalococcoidia bacterium]|jgi:dihydrolipoamide dehydrogenase
MAEYDVATVGGGPGGYVAAIRAGQLGLKTVLIEKDRVGGVCLNWGCIPSKALLSNAEIVRLVQRGQEFGIACDNPRFDFAAAIDRSRQVVDRMVSGVEFLLQKNKVDVVKGAGTLKSAGEVAVEPSGDLVQAKNVIIASGGFARTLPGVAVDGSTVMTSREALELRQVPESIAIVGGGPIGVEFAYLYASYGARVMIIELLDRLLPLEDEDVSRQLERSFKQQGIEFMTRAEVKELRVEGGRARLSVSVAGEPREVNADKVLIAVGFGGKSDGVGIEALGIKTERGFIQVDDRMKTNVPGVYAIGDVTGKLMLAHVASDQGIIAVEDMAGLEPPKPDYVKMPRCTYCQPQVASCGLTESQARERGYQVKTGRFPFRANGKAMAAAEMDGFVKVVAEADYGEVLGVHIIGADATDLIAEAALALAMESTLDDLTRTVHAHPTLSEAVKEAALAAGGKAIHFWAAPSRGETI